MQYLAADDLAKKVCDAIGVDYNFTARVIIDLQANQPAMVHVQLIGSKRLLEINWGELLECTGGINVVDAPAPIIPPYDGEE